MYDPSRVRLVPRTLLSVLLLLLLTVAASAPAALASEPTSFDPFFYGQPRPVSSVGLAVDATGTPMATIEGYVAGYDTTSTMTATVYVEIYDTSGSFLGFESAATEHGYYSMADVPAGTGELRVSYDSTQVYLRLGGLQLVEGLNNVNIVPGAVKWTNETGGPLGASPNLLIRLGGTSSATGGLMLSNHSFFDADPFGKAWSLPGAVRWGQCYYRANEVATSVIADTNSAFMITEGELSLGQIDFEQGSAARMRIVSPRWRSGKPGTVMKMRFENWPVWTRLTLTGLDASVPATTWNDLTYDVSTSPSTRTLNLTVPGRAKAGGRFLTLAEGTVTQSDVPISVSTLFQVCTLKPDRTRIAKGQAVRLSGRVPVRLGPDGTAGTRKDVTIWARSKAAADAPAKWDPRPAGWRKVATVRTDRFGRYVTPKLKPGRSTSYVCRYPGDAWHFRAYTSVCRVTVR